MGDNQDRDQMVEGKRKYLSSGIRAEIPRWAMGVMIAILMIVIITMMLMPSLGKARRAAVRDDTSPSRFMSLSAASISGLTNDSIDGVLASASDRKLIRTATISLRVDNIETAARDAVALLLTSEGEYASELRLVGSGGSAQGSLTLRVRNERLDAALDALQALGQVEELSIASQDVTETLVDLAARLRNERRIEAELLELMDSRSGDELKQVLELRRELGRVRESIERLDAKQASLARRVELATVRLALYGHSIETRAGFWGVTGRRVGESWSGGLDMTSRTLAGLIEIAVGGSLWWLALVLGGTIIWRFLQRKNGAAQSAGV